jgi:phosphatidylserine/phosphatidylglycerophosphate/cardiolipin synthase-like enzyme
MNTATIQLPEQVINNHKAQSIREQLQRALRQVEQLKAQLHSDAHGVPMQWLEMHEHRPILERTLQQSRTRLMIISPWIRASAVNLWFVQKLEKLLRRGVKVYIGYGLGEEEKDMSHTDLAAEQDLLELARKYPHSFIFRRLGDTHAKILISDSSLAITTSFNWLSFRGQSHRMFRDERGTLVSEPGKVNELFDSMLEQFYRAQS